MNINRVTSLNIQSFGNLATDDVYRSRYGNGVSEKDYNESDSFSKSDNRANFEVNSESKANLNKILQSLSPEEIEELSDCICGILKNADEVFEFKSLNSLPEKLNALYDILKIQGRMIIDMKQRLDDISSRLNNVNNDK